MTRLDIGILSLTGPDRRLRSGEDRAVLLVEADLAALFRARDFEVVQGSAPYPEEDKVAADPPMARRHAAALHPYRPAVVVVNLVGPVAAQDVIAVVHGLGQDLRAPVRLVVFADPASDPEATATFLAVTGALRRSSFPHHAIIGNRHVATVQDELIGAITFHRERAQKRERAVSVCRILKTDRALIFGATVSAARLESVDLEVLRRDLGVAVDVLPEARLADLARALREAPADRRLATAGDGAHAAEQARRFAVEDLARECDATLAIFDGEAPMGLGAEREPDGSVRDSFPAAGHSDLMTGLGQLVLQRAAKRPAHFARVAALTDRGLRLDRAPPIPEGEATAVRFEIRGGRMRLNAIEAEWRDGEVRLPLPTAAFVERWRSPHLAIAAGWHAPLLCEVAHELGIPCGLIDHTGRAMG